MALFTASAEEWIAQAQVLGKSEKVIDYLKQYPQKYFDPTGNLYPRAWEFVSKTLCTNTLKSILQNKDEIQEIFAEALGQEEARIFMAFLENNI